MHTLKFDNPEFRKGLNVTVRAGKKWAERVKPGDLIALAEVMPGDEEAHAEKIGYAEVFDVQHLPNIEAIPDIWLRLEHDKSCSTKIGLIEAMDRAYPLGYSDVTVLKFLKLSR